jgi:hypothetical protein
MRISKRNARRIRSGIEAGAMIVRDNRKGLPLYSRLPDDHLAARAYFHTIDRELTRLAKEAANYRDRIAKKVERVRLAIRRSR